MHAHPGALAILATYSDTTPPQTGGKAEISCTLVSWGGTYGLISQNKLLVLSVPPLIDPANITLGASICDAAEKPIDSRELRRAGLTFEIWLQPLDRQNR
jgi:hypothetical protein